MDEITWYAIEKVRLHNLMIPFGLKACDSVKPYTCWKSVIHVPLLIYLEETIHSNNTCAWLFTVFVHELCQQKRV